MLKSAGEIFLSGLKGAKHFSVAFRIVFRIFFSRFSNRFLYRFKSFFGGSFVLQTCRPKKKVGNAKTDPKPQHTLPKTTCRKTTRTNITIKFGVLNLQCYFGEAVCTGLFCADFLRGFFARIFCTDFLHGFFARIFCTDFLHGFSARIFCTFFCPIFLRGFLHGLLARIVCTDAARIFARIFWGVPKHLLESAKISPRKSPEKFTMLWGPSGEGLGRQEGEVRLWPA